MIFRHFLKHETYFFISKVDSSWKTCALEKTVLVFLFRLQCMIWLLLSVDLSIDSSSSSSSIDSLTSSSDSCDEFNCWFGDDVVVAVFGELVTDADCLSGVLNSTIKINQLFQMAALLWIYKNKSMFMWLNKIPLKPYGHIFIVNWINLSNKIIWNIP